MKSLLLLLLLPLLACGHEHPLTDHEHDPQFKYPEMLNFAYIVDIDPPLTGEIPPKRGVLTKNVTPGGREVQSCHDHFFQRIRRPYDHGHSRSCGLPHHPCGLAGVYHKT